MSPELEALGITTMEVSETATQLSIRGRDSNNQIVASVELTTGTFVMQDDDRGAVDGRQLAVEVLGKRLRHESQGYETLHLPLSHPGPRTAFLDDELVRAKLAKWGVELDEPAVPVGALSLGSEQPYVECVTAESYSGACQTSNWGGCTVVNGKKKQFDAGSYGGYTQYGEFRVCTGGTVAERRCTAPSASTACGTAGGQGCAVCWTNTYVGTAQIYTHVQTGSCKMDYCPS